MRKGYSKTILFSYCVYVKQFETIKNHYFISLSHNSNKLEKVNNHTYSAFGDAQFY